MRRFSILKNGALFYIILNFGQPAVNESNFSLKLPTPKNLEQSILYLKLNKKQSF